MTWTTSLLDASFRGIKFDCLSTEDEVNRAVVEHSYPFVHGSDLEDLGNEAQGISIVAIFFGDDYEAQLKTFVSALDVLGSGELIHPIFGTLTAQIMNYKISHSADNVDQAQVTLTFKRDTPQPELFNRDLPIQKTQAVSQAVTTSRTAAGGVLAKEVTKISALKSALVRVDALRTTMTSALSNLRGQAFNIVTSGLDVINYPLSFATDIGSLINGAVDLRGFNIGSLLTDWRYVSNLFSKPITLSTSVTQPARDVQLVSSYVALTQATGKADATQIVLASEVDTPTLSAPDIEAMVNDARTDIEACINTYRNLYTLEDSRPVVEALKTTALALQEAARAIIEARPPLITRKVDAPGNLRLIAHKWYGDHTRAPELFRLNKQLRMPNYLSQGDVLNAYAQ